MHYLTIYLEEGEDAAKGEHARPDDLTDEGNDDESQRVAEAIADANFL